MGARARLAAAATALACSAVLITAALLTPDPRGYGTHQQLGAVAGVYPPRWAPCGTMLVTGYPCPTCGMTTAFAHVMHGHPIAAFIAQPTGMLLCIATIIGVAVSLRIALTGRAPLVYWHRFAPVPIALALSIFFVGGWAFKVLHGLLAGTLPVR